MAAEVAPADRRAFSRVLRRNASLSLVLCLRPADIVELIAGPYSPINCLCFSFSVLRIASSVFIEAA